MEDWLAKKYASTDAMKAACRLVNVDLGAEALNRDGAMAHWPLKTPRGPPGAFQQDGDSVSTWERFSTPPRTVTPPVPDRPLAVDKNRNSRQQPLVLSWESAVRKDQPYTLSFKT